MIKLLILLTFLISFTLYAQEDKGEVTTDTCKVFDGQGKTYADFENINGNPTNNTDKQ